jgi:3-dehydroquinate dehydratase-2
MTHRVLILHGPLLDLETVLGQSLAALDEALVSKGRDLGLDVDTVQALAEADLVKALLERRDGLTGVIVNPSSLAPTAYTLADALEALALPCVEVQLEHESKARGRSALKRVVDKQFHGHGVDGYFKALASLAKQDAPAVAHEADPVAHRDEAADEPAPTPGDRPAPRGKTIGRQRPPPPAAAAPERPGKTIGRKTTEPTSSASPSTPAAPSNAITRAQVKAQLSARLAKTLSPDDFAAWARTQWLAIQRGAPTEPGHKDALEELLLMLSTTAKASDHVILSWAAKLS